MPADKTRNDYPVARKEYRCSFCWEPIAQGEKHFSKRFGPMDHPENDHFFTVRSHAVCWNLEDSTRDDDDLFNFDNPEEFKLSLARSGKVEVCPACDGNGEDPNVPRNGWGYRDRCAACAGNGLPAGPPKRKETAAVVYR